MARARSRKAAGSERPPRWSDSVAAEALRAMPEAVVVCDRDGRIVAANDAVHELLGYPEGKLVGRRLEKLVPEDLRDLHRTHREAFVEQKGPGAHRAGRLFKARHRDGHLVPVDVAIANLRAEDGPLSLALLRGLDDPSTAGKQITQLADLYAVMARALVRGAARRVRGRPVRRRLRRRHRPRRGQPGLGGRDRRRRGVAGGGERPAGRGRRRPGRPPRRRRAGGHGRHHGHVGGRARPLAGAGLPHRPVRPAGPGRFALRAPAASGRRHHRRAGVREPRDLGLHRRGRHGARVAGRRGLLRPRRARPARARARARARAGDDARRGRAGGRRPTRSSTRSPRPHRRRRC